jgi:hypothetical protein
MDDIVSALHGQERVPLFKQNISSATAQWQSMWTMAGVPSAGATPATGAGSTATSATAGALKFTDPSGANHKRLLAANLVCTARGLAVLCDRLVHTSGLSGTVTTAQTVNTTALPSGRDANGAANGDGVEAWLECYTSLGGTGRNVSVSYTNSAGTAGQTGSAIFPGSLGAGRMVPMALAAGDTGVRSVENLTLSGTTGTAGNFGVTLLRRICHIELPNSGAACVKGPFDLGMPRIYAGSCLMFKLIFDGSSTQAFFGDIVMGEK